MCTDTGCLYSLAGHVTIQHCLQSQYYTDRGREKRTRSGWGQIGEINPQKRANRNGRLRGKEEGGGRRGKTRRERETGLDEEGFSARKSQDFFF